MGKRERRERDVILIIARSFKSGDLRTGGRREEAAKILFTVGEMEIEEALSHSAANQA